MAAPITAPAVSYVGPILLDDMLARQFSLQSCVSRCGFGAGMINALENLGNPVLSSWLRQKFEPYNFGSYIGPEEVLCSITGTYITCS